MLKPGGHFYWYDVIFSFPPAEYESAIAAWIDRAAKTENEGWTKQEYEMHVREEHSTFAWVIEGMLERSRLNIVENNYLSPAIAEYLCEKTS